MPRPATRRFAVALAVVLGLAGCTLDDGGDSPADPAGTVAPGDPENPDAPPPDAMVPTTSHPDQTVVLTEEAPEQLAAAASQTFFDTAPLVVLVAPGEELRGASAAVSLGVPVLMDGPAAAEEIDRLGAEVVIGLGAVADPGVEVVLPPDDSALAELVGADPAPTDVAAGEEIGAVAELDPAAPRLLAQQAAAEGSGQSPTGDAADRTAGPPATATRDDLPKTAPAPPLEGVTLMTTGEVRDLLAVATARSAGASVLVATDGDPRATSELVQATAAAAPSVVVGLGASFGDAETLQWRTQTAATGVELPGGGQLALPGKMYVALYGNPLTSALGVLGEQGASDTIARAEQHAEPYRALTDTTVVPALEIIATVASAGAGGDGNYSNEIDVGELRPLVDLAAEHGQYVVLDLQPGRTDFVTQARLYEELLLEPHVGLALDPEWRLLPDEVHMRRIGHVDLPEVDQVVTYLADLTREHSLPQKLLVLHQFQVRMIPGVNDVDQSRTEVAVLVHADGQGPQGSKQETWRSLHANAPDIRFWGWKNFYDEDSPMLTPEQTMQVEPTPDFVSYQ